MKLMLALIVTITLVGCADVKEHCKQQTKQDYSACVNALSM